MPPKPTSPAAPDQASETRKPDEVRVLLERASFEQVVAAAFKLAPEERPGIFQRAGWLEGMRLVGAYDEIVSDLDPDLAIEITALDIINHDWRLVTRRKKQTAETQKKRKTRPALPEPMTDSDRLLNEANEALARDLESDRDEDPDIRDDDDEDDENEDDVKELDLDMSSDRNRKSGIENLDSPSDNRDDDDNRGGTA